MSTNPDDALRLALWQTPLPAPADEARAGLERLEVALRAAAAQGAQWLLTPEMAMTGYAIGSERVHALAESADGPLALSVAALASQHRIGVVYGFPEHNGHGKPYNSVQAIGPEGQRLACYRKTHLYGDIDAAQFSPGQDTPPVIDTAGWRLGLLICYDVEFPEPARDLALRGADVLMVATANMVDFPEVSQCLVPARACENRVAVAYANACGEERLGNVGLRYGGLSTLCGPMGDKLAQADHTPTLLVRTLQRSALEVARKSSQLPHRQPALYGSLCARDDQ